MRLKLRGKLLGAAAAVSLISLGIGAVAMSSLQMAARQSRVLYEKIAVPLEHLYVLGEAYEEVRIGILEAIYAVDPAVAAEKREGIRDHIEEAEKEAGIFEASLMGDKAKADFADFRTAFASFKALIGEAEDLDSRKDHSSALGLLDGRMLKVIDRLETSLDKVRTNKVSQAQQLSADNDSNARIALGKMAAITLGIFVLCFFFGIGFAVSIAKPLHAAARMAGHIASGDLTHSIEEQYKRRGDEIGTLSASLDTMRSDLSGSVSEIRESVDVIQDLGKGLSASAEATASAVAQIQATMDSIGNRVISQSASVTETSSTIDQIIHNIDALDREIESQSAGVAQSSASIEEMVGSIRSVSKSVQRLGEAFGTLLSASGDGKSKVNAVTGLVRTIAEQSEKLIAANTAITEISDRTNLLAMNAAIEAAHAGSAGKGFAVVAAEIRRLAESTGQRSKEISGDVRSIKTAIDAVVDSSEAAERSFTQILEQIESLASLEDEIKRAMGEQDEGSKAILEALAQIADITRRVRSGSTEMLEGSRNIGKEMGGLLELSERLKTDIVEVVRSTVEIKTDTESVSVMSEKSAGLIDIVSAKVARYSLSKEGAADD